MSTSTLLYVQLLCRLAFTEAYLCTSYLSTAYPRVHSGTPKYALVWLLPDACIQPEQPFRDHASSGLRYLVLPYAKLILDVPE